MNNFIPKRNKKNQTLVLVEGEHEKEELLYLIFECFPEISISLSNVHIYNTDIYDLYHRIEKEYGEDWYEEDDEIDIPLLISRKNNLQPKLDKRMFTNIILMFDYEHHDNWYSDEKIKQLQKHFNSVSDDGILYINYPMVEYYQDMSSIPDRDYLNKTVAASMKAGSEYKSKVHEYSVIWQYILFYKKNK